MNAKKMRIGINGFGRIGRIFMRLCLKSQRDGNLNFEIVAINDLLSVEEMAYLLKYDSTHGNLNPLKYKIRCLENELIINDSKISVSHCKNPKEIPWEKNNVDIVLESTGLFLTLNSAKEHLNAKTKYVVMSAPAKENDIPTFVMGVNEDKFNPQKDFVISNASCTTNCLAPLVKIIDDHFGVHQGLMTTIHALTASQKIVDGPGGKDFCAGRSAFVNIAPASTGAAKAVGLVLPHLLGKLTGLSFRVPVVDGSVVDLTLQTLKPTSLKQIIQVIQDEINNTKNPIMKKVMGITEDPIVSSDIIGNEHSSIFDVQASIELNNQFFKLISWYDNETGYCARLRDLISFIGTKTY